MRGSDSDVPIRVHCCLSERELLNQSRAFPEVPSSLSLLSSLEWHRLSKALLKSNRTTAVICPLSIALKMSSVTNKLNVSVECRDRFPL